MHRNRIVALITSCIFAVLLLAGLSTLNPAKASPSRGVIPNDYSKIYGSGWTTSPNRTGAYFHTPADQGAIDGYWMVRVRTQCDAPGPNGEWASIKAVVDTDKWANGFDSNGNRLYFGYRETDPLYNDSTVRSEIDQEFYYHNPDLHESDTNGENALKTYGRVYQSGSYDGHHPGLCQYAFQIWYKTNAKHKGDWWWSPQR